jgi:hypothetical protein
LTDSAYSKFAYDDRLTLDALTDYDLPRYIGRIEYQDIYRNVTHGCVIQIADFLPYDLSFNATHVGELPIAIIPPYILSFDTTPRIGAPLGQLPCPA